jgi:hypothetical protein
MRSMFNSWYNGRKVEHQYHDMYVFYTVSRFWYFMFLVFLFCACQDIVCVSVVILWWFGRRRGRS